MKIHTRIILGIAGCMFAAGVMAQSYPAKPIMLINPWQVGGGVDVLARTLGGKLQERLGQPVVVESKAGAGGNIGTTYVVKSPADGYTLLINNGTLTTSPSFFANIPFDPVKDLAPISMIARQQFYLVVTNSLPVNNMQELIAYAKANPGKLFYATPGIGTPQHLGGELLKSLARIDITHSPYKGQAPAINDLMGGQVQMGWVTMESALPLIKAGKLKGIALGARERVPSQKDIPVVAETIPGFEIYTWVALFAPAGTPPDIVEKLHDEVVRFAALPDVNARLSGIGYEVKTTTSAELRALMAAELTKWAKVTRDAGIKPE